MALPRPDYNPNQPVPNEPFDAPEQWALKSGATELTAGEGLEVIPGQSTIIATGAGGGVVRIDTGNGITGGPITREGTISLTPTGISAGTYCYSNFTLDIYGRITAVSPAPLATCTNVGAIRIASFFEVQTSTSLDTAVSPAGLQAIKSNAVDDTSQYGIATPYAVKQAYDKALQAIFPTAFTAKGQILAATGSGAYVALPVGNEGQILTVCSTCPSGLTWTASSFGADIPCSAFTSYGQLLVGTGASQFTTLGSGTDGFALVACAACTSTGGLTWAFISGGGTGSPPATPTAFGTVYGRTDSSTLTAIGYGALGSVCCDTSNTAVGHNAAAALTTGIRNTALGSISLTRNTTGNCNVAVGYSSLDGNTFGCFNTAVGTSALCVSIGSCNTALGYGAGIAHSSGDRNIFLGFLAGAGQTVGSDNIFIGTPAPPIGGLNCNVIIGVAGCDRLKFNACGALAFQGDCYGTSGYFLQSNGAGQAPGWVPGTNLAGCFTTRGQLLAGAGASIFATLNPGSEGQVLAICNSCLTGLTWITNTAGPGIPCNIIQSRGDIIVGLGASTPSRLGLGLNGQVLTVNIACPGGLTWAASGGGGGGIPCSVIQAYGDIIVGLQSDTPARVALGTEGQLLSVNRSCPSGVAWVTCSGGGGGSGIPCTLIQAKGDLIAGIEPGNPGYLSVGNNGQVLTACADCALGLAWVTPSAGGPSIPCAIIQGKGGLVVGVSASNPGYLGRGSDGQVLTSCTACTLGLAWVTPGAGGSSIPCAIIQAPGDLIVGSGAALPVRLGRGLPRTVLTANCVGTIGWESLPAATTNDRGMVYGRSDSLICGNTTLGYLAGFCSCTGTTPSCACFNVAIGLCALFENKTGDANVAIGYNALREGITVAGNTVVGCGAGQYLTGCRAIAIGENALGGQLINGQESVGIGVSALCNSMGTRNTAIGYFAGASHCTTGSNNVFLGSLAGEQPAFFSVDNWVIIGNCLNTCYWANKSWSFPQDIRYQNVIGPVPLALSFVNSLNPVIYQDCDCTTGLVTNPKCYYGFSAQCVIATELSETNQADPVIAGTYDPDNYTMEPTALIPVLVNAIKELSDKVAALEAIVNP